MTFLLELRGKIYRIIGKREKIVLAAVKFVIALLLFLTISEMVGYMEKLQNPFLLLILACLCALPILPHSLRKEFRLHHKMQ